MSESQRYYIETRANVIASNTDENVLKMLKAVRVKNIRKALKFGWSNQPSVFTFNATKEQVKELDSRLYDYIVRPHWNEGKTITQL